MGLSLGRTTYATPGINPNAPDPLAGLGQPVSTGGLSSLGQQAQAPAQGGLGLGSPPAPAQAPAAPAERPLGALGQAGVALQDIASSLNGGPKRSDQIAAQRTQALQAQLQQFQQGLAILELTRQGLDRLPAEKQESAAAALRNELAVKVPGLATLYDATVGDRSTNAKFALAAAEKSNTVKYMVAQGFPVGAIAEFMGTPEFRAEVQQTQDKTLTPIVTQKLEQLLSTDDPVIGPRVREAQKDGLLTPPEIRAINAGLPDEYKLTDEELDTLDRQQGPISQVFQGRVATTEEYEAKKADERAARAGALQATAKEKALRDLGPDQRAIKNELDLYREKLKLDADKEIKVAQAKDEAKGPALTPGEKAQDRDFARFVSEFSAQGGFSAAARDLAELDEIISLIEGDPEANVEGANVSGRVLGSLPDIIAPQQAVDVRDRVARISQQSLRAILGGQFAQREAEQLIQRAYNPALDEKYNLERLKALREQAQAAFDQKLRAAEFFEENGTLRGFKGSLATDLESIKQENRKGAASTPEGMVRMVAPDGTVGLVPADRAEEARADGLREVD